MERIIGDGDYKTPSDNYLLKRLMDQIDIDLDGVNKMPAQTNDNIIRWDNISLSLFLYFSISLFWFVSVFVCVCLFFFSFKSLCLSFSPSFYFIFRKYQERKYHPTSMTDASSFSPDTANIPEVPRTQPPPNSLQTVEYSLGPTQKARRNYFATQYRKRQLNG